MKVYQAINAVQKELAATGIGKDSTNTFDNYKFRGIDAVYNALAPLLAKHALCVLPRMVSREVVERTSDKNKALFYVTVEAEFDFVSAEDGSKHTVRTFGEAMDRGDKATNKAMSAAYKYAAFQAFAIPTEGDNDADAHSHEVRSRDTSNDGRPRSGAWEAMDADQQIGLQKIAAAVVDILTDESEPDKNTREAAAHARIEREKLDSDEKIALWTLLDSKTRSALKRAAANHAAQHQKEAA